MYYRFKELSELGSLTIKKIELLTFRNIVCKNNSMTTILEISKNVVVIVLTFKTHLGTFLHNCLFFSNMISSYLLSYLLISNGTVMRIHKYFIRKQLYNMLFQIKSVAKYFSP